MIVVWNRLYTRRLPRALLFFFSHFPSWSIFWYFSCVFLLNCNFFSFLLSYLFSYVFNSVNIITTRHFYSIHRKNLYSTGSPIFKYLWNAYVLCMFIYKYICLNQFYVYKHLLQVFLFYSSAMIAGFFQ